MANLRNIIKVGLGGIIRDTLVQASYVVSCWPLCEITDTRANDIANGYNIGAYSGSGTTRGLTMGLPEGGLAATFNGSGYVQVTDDGDGYTLPGDANSRDLSLSGGDMDILFFMKTSTNDATLRCIVQKQETNSSGNGWHVALQNGAIEFYLKVSGSAIFNFQRGSVSDGAWHLIHCLYIPGSNLARIYIDGVASGADATGSTEPAVNTGNLRIGMFNDGAGGYIGSLAYVTVAREGSTTLAATVQAGRSWTDITSDVVEQIECDRGFGGSDLLSRCARPGKLSFELANFAQGARPIGYYTPGHANARTGWQERIPVTWVVTDDASITETRFHGYINSIQPAAGLYRTRRVAVDATSWLGLVMTTPIRSVPVQVGATAGAVFGAVIDGAFRPPVAVQIATGDSTFAYALDDTRDSPLLQVLARVAMSEGSLAYELADGTIVFEALTDRTADVTAVDTFTNAIMSEMTPVRDIEAIRNKIELDFLPRTASGSAVVLGTMNARVFVPANGGVVDIEIPYRDPAQTDAKVGGTSIVTPVVTTDFTMYQNEDGTGTNLSANATVAVDAAWKGGSATRMRVTNTGTTDGWFKTQVRGTALYSYDVTTILKLDRESQRRYDVREQKVQTGYQSDPTLADLFGVYLLMMQKDPIMLPTGLLVRGRTSNNSRIASREIGELVAVTESMSGLSAALFMISNIRMTAHPGGDIQAEYDFMLTPGRFLWVMGASGYSELDSTAIVAP